MKGLHRGIALPEIESLLREGVVAGIPDRELLDRFISSRDRRGELAFTALVARYGPMVLGVCRRILRDPTEADDAFQATFLILARKAGAIRLADSLGPWLYGVSTRVARRLQVVASRRRTGGVDDEWLASIPDRQTAHLRDLERRQELDESLETLPDSFRAALRLCYFEGLTHEEAAARLGCPVGTVRSRLARGRALLRRRLEPARIPPGADPPPATLVPSLVLSTSQAAARLAAGHPLAGVAPARVAEVATGVIAAMCRTKIVAAILVALGSLAGWGAWAAHAVPRAGDDRPAPGAGRGPGGVQDAECSLIAAAPNPARAGKTSALAANERSTGLPPIVSVGTSTGGQSRGGSKGSRGSRTRNRPASGLPTFPPSSSRRSRSSGTSTSTRPRPGRSASCSANR